ncbi:uncharacterized protein LOC123296303, partial [Chrysoperla carnea]|uniref:uncharacterized protein LOC123296303 n=1 Tax=Chrysoperla carnea TaxID=189513 RepID=UPI001D05F306
IMLRIICFLIIALVSLSQSDGVNIADDFSTEIFSELLNDWGYEHLGQRFKRHPHPRDEMECCGDPPNQDTMEMVKECFESMKARGRPNSDEEGMNRGLCLADCVGKIRKVVNDNGIVDKATFVVELKKYDSDEWRQEQMEKSYDICIEAAEKFKVKMAEKISDLECDPLAAGFFHCQMRGIVKNCPDDKFKADQKKCTWLKEMLERSIEEM